LRYSSRAAEADWRARLSAVKAFCNPSLATFKSSGRSVGRLGWRRCHSVMDGRRLIVGFRKPQTGEAELSEPDVSPRFRKSWTPGGFILAFGFLCGDSGGSQHVTVETFCELVIRLIEFI
jgi:hypothetical protein